jgi:hypothetical protein
MTAPAHTVRNSLADKERSFTLGTSGAGLADMLGRG